MLMYVHSPLVAAERRRSYAEARDRHSSRDSAAVVEPVPLDKLLSRVLVPAWSAVERKLLTLLWRHRTQEKSEPLAGFFIAARTRAEQHAIGGSR